jgi:hypothetical protein
MPMTDRQRFIAADLLPIEIPPGVGFLLRMEEDQLRERAVRGLEAIAALVFREHTDEDTVPADLLALYERYSTMLGVDLHSDLLEACLYNDEYPGELEVTA